MGRIITITQGEEFKVSINGKGITEDDFFYPQYEQAATHVEQIVNSISKEKGIDDHTFKYDSEKDYLNNIIAFCGERGSGKTTAMKTFSYALSENVDNIIFGNATKKKKFCNIKTIDPSCFESIHDVLSIVVARMFKDFESIYDKDESELLDDLKCKILNLFQIVYRNLTMMQNTRKYIDQEYEYDGDVQKLSNIASSANLKENLYQLIDKYLTLKKADYLLVMIDDIDLNIESAYKLSEEVRRYLSIPNVIIVMAIRIEQLNYCVKKELAKDFRRLLEIDDHYDLELNTMTNKYLNKLIPESRRIILPDLRDSIESIDNSVVVKYLTDIRNEQGQMKSNLFNNDSESLEKAILKFIYEATGSIFIQKKGIIHPIIPSTLRELIVLYDYLGKMIVNENMDTNIYLNNLSVLHDYIINVWCKNNLNTYLQEVIKIWEVKSIEDKNKYMCEQIQLIVEMFKSGQITHDFQEKNTLVYHEKWFFDKVDYANRQSKIYSFSFGEVLNLLMDLDELVKIKDIGNFTSCSLMLYTVLLNKLKLKDGDSTEKREFMQPNEANMIIAGNLWGKRMNDIFAKEKMDNQLRSRVIFKYDVINVLLAKFKFMVEKNQQLYMSNDNYEEIINDDEIDFLYILSCMSHFGTKDSNRSWNEQLIAGNRRVKANAIFRFDNLLLMSIDPSFTLDKIRYESYAEKSFDNFKLKELQDSVGLNTPYFIDIIYNPELSKYILEEQIRKKPDIRFDKENESVYMLLFKSILKSSLEAHKMISKTEDNDDKQEDDVKNKGTISFKYISKYLDEISKYAEKSDFKLKLEIASIEGDLQVNKFRKRCVNMMNFLEANIDMDDSFEGYKKEIEKLYKLSTNPQLKQKDIIDANLVKEYNYYWDILNNLVR